MSIYRAIFVLFLLSQKNGSNLEKLPRSQENFSQLWKCRLFNVHVHVKVDKRFSEISWSRHWSWIWKSFMKTWFILNVRIWNKQKETGRCWDTPITRMCHWRIVGCVSDKNDWKRSRLSLFLAKTSYLLCVYIFCSDVGLVSEFCFF